MPTNLRTVTGRLVDKVAIVTGASSGIGRATALALASEGARAALVGRREGPLRQLAEEIGDRAMVVPADVRDVSQVKAMVARTMDAWNRIDILVNSAGMNVPRRGLGEISLAAWRDVFATNVTGPFLVVREVLPVMRRQRAGTIVNVSSMAGYRGKLLGGPAYGASKAALNSLTEAINLAERQNGVRACAICPGEVATPILDIRPNPPSAAARATMLQPDDIAQTVLLIASLPARAAVELVLIRPTILRDDSEDLGRRGPDAKPS
jgi:NAD(P)-dependent dehydrogenase (short-subunit alcohol dehydrogenase family)